MYINFFSQREESELVILFCPRYVCFEILAFKVIPIALSLPENKRVINAYNPFNCRYLTCKSRKFRGWAIFRQKVFPFWPSILAHFDPLLTEK